MDNTTTSETTESSAPPAEERIEIPKRDPAEIKAYQGAKRVVHIVDILVSIAYWLIWCWQAPAFVAWLDDSLGNRWLALLVTAVAMLGGSVLVMLPLSYYSGFLLEHRFNLSNQTPKAWFVFQVKSWIVGGILGGVVLGGFYAALWYSGPLWGVWIWIGMLVLSVVLAKIFPLIILPLFYPAKELDRPSLTDRLKELAGEAGMTITGIFNLEMSKETKKANAMLAGLGSSRRVYLSDTLLGAFDDEQIAVVFAHELGHHIRRHIFKLIALSAVVTSLLVSLIYWRLDRYAGVAEAGLDGWGGAVAGLAQVMLIASVFPLVSGIVTNAISRRFERQCDSDALRLTDSPDAYRQAFENLGDLNLEDPQPPRWEVILFEDHPPLAERIAMADTYESARSTGA